MNDDPVRPVVLLVDDDEEIRNVARGFFRESKYRIDSAWSLDTALNVFHQYPNDLMVGFVDIHMGESTAGLDIIRYGHEYLPHRAVLYGWTGHWTLEMEERVFVAGGHDLLVKDEHIFERMEIRTQYPNALALVEKTSKDPLTNLKSLPAFQDDVLLEMTEMKERKRWEALHVVVMDMANFKYINDNYGHLVGDRCLKEVADVIRSHVRRRDYPCRMYGDEFAICMAGVSRRRAMKTAREIQAAVAGLRVEVRKGIEIPLYLDWGLAELRRMHISYPFEPLFIELVRAADKRMYAAKQARKEGKKEER